MSFFIFFILLQSHKCVVVPAAVPAVGSLRAHHALSHIVLELLLGGIVGVAVGAANIVDEYVVRSSGNGLAKLATASAIRLIKFVLCRVRRSGDDGDGDPTNISKSGDDDEPINVSSLSSSLCLIIIFIFFIVIIIWCYSSFCPLSYIICFEFSHIVLENESPNLHILNSKLSHKYW